MFKKLFYTGLALVLVFSCREDDEVVNTPPVAVDSTLTVDLSGYVQKGPFINGTAITISELDKKLVTTGKNFTTQIADNKGSFSLKGVKLKSNFVQLQADGFYFDEVKGEKSAAQLTLFALSDVEDVSSINANLLSHMERSRVIYLMQEKGQSFAEAKQQAQAEILAVFGIAKEEMQQSELLDISQDGDDNAILLAISAVLQANNTVAELSELVANIITDLREDGVLNSQSNKDKIREQGKMLNLPQIRLNLEKRYEELGVEASIPNFEQYIDSDGDGILNKDEDDNPDDFMFTLQKDVAVSIATTSNPVKISGLKEGGTANAVVRNGQIVLNGKVSTDTAVQVKNGDALQLQLTSSQAYADTVKATVSIGTVVKHFQVITDDYVPNTFSFTAQKDVAVDSLYTSNTLTVSGIPFATPLQIEGGRLIKNGKVVSSDTVSVKNGDQIAVQLLSSSAYASVSSATVAINGIIASFALTTDDYKPDTFSFTAIENAKVDSLYTSNIITISGLPFPAPVSVEGGMLIKNGNEPSADKIILVQNGDQLAVKLLSSSAFISSKTAILNINGIKASFKITTDDYAPDDFGFVPVVNVEPNSAIYSDTIVVTGLKYPTPIEIEGGSLFINGLEVPNTGYILKEGDQINIELLSSSFFYTTTSSMISIGSKYVEYKVTTYQNPWKKKDSFPGEANGYQIGFGIKDKVYIGLGRNDGSPITFSKEFFAYDSYTQKWIKLADFPASSRTNGISLTVSGMGYIGLGWAWFNSENVITYNDFWKYDPLQEIWTRAPDYPAGRWLNSYAFTVGSSAYVGGGHNNDGLNNQKMWAYTATSEVWEEKSFFTGSRGFAIDDKGYVFRAKDDTYELWEYTLESNTWQKRNSIFLWNPPLICTLNNTAYLFSPEDGVLQYDSDADLWKKVILPEDMPKLVFDAGGFTVAVANGKSIYILEGHEFWEFTPPQK
ncbi:Kelch repeat-containing protein [Catalinimonas niigatensis]|uniref:Kelch repeat-containing protein n=1 Tax=Catalinimonas niigatensis TaxID=1397264 RepID=UPI002665FA99|nr:hypothetical protein [Catalinimonas niigatensis]WPP52726.1 hypothetical protein PZB72_10080 [Catalinimonas niigatensis]